MHITARLAEPIPSSTRRTEQARLHRALRDAAKVRGLSDSVLATGAALISFIPTDAPAPVSPVQVQRLADDRGLDARTIRHHIAQLITAGVAANCCRDGGGRSLVRAPDGAIVSLHGISFAPLAAEADKLSEAAAELAAIATEKARLRAEISAVRRRIKRRIDAVAPSDEHRRLYERLPRRIAHLELADLVRLWSGVEDLYAALLQAEYDEDGLSEPACDSVEISDRSEISGRQLNITTGPKDHSGNRNAIDIAGKLSSSAARPAVDRQGTCGLEHVRLGMALEAAPKEWRLGLLRDRRPSWTTLATVAYEQAPRLGINPSALALAHAAIGKPGTALLVLIADANRVERGGSIRNPGAWVRRMAERAESGQAYLHRSIFGILERKRESG